MPSVCPNCSGMFSFTSRHEYYYEMAPSRPGRGARECAEMGDAMREEEARAEWQSRPSNLFPGYSSASLSDDDDGGLIGYKNENGAFISLQSEREDKRESQ